jgi:FtsP/CotA-like multicopper oxidase with cupredoxin domain
LFEPIPNIATRARTLRFLLCVAIALVLAPAHASAQTSAPDVCPRPAPGSTVSEPTDLRSQNGILRVHLTIRSSLDAQGHSRYCYFSGDGSQAPNLRLNPGDVLVLNLKNDVEASAPHAKHPMASMQMKTGDFCSRGRIAASSTNLHFHGLTIPPVCHQDDVLKTAIAPGDAPFEYRFQIPRDEPPGLYWYHPHIHGFTSAQVLGGASGALIVEGIERVNPQIAGMPERVFVIRDQELQSPNAEPTAADSARHPVELRDAEGDVLNTGMDGGKPAKDLSINFVPVPYPAYQPAMIAMKPGEKQFWRVLNASAITYLDLQVVVGDTPRFLEVAAVDGVPIADGGDGGHGMIRKSHILVPPAGRVEFIVTGPPEGTRASLVTRNVDTGPAGENDPTRTLAIIVASAQAPKTNSSLPAASMPLATRSSPSLQTIKPARVRKLYLSEEPQTPGDLNSPTTFFITVEGQKRVPFDMNASTPNIIVRQGDVEDWIIENRSQELHAFHIHQIHFMLLDWNGVPIDEPFLRDTVNVAYWDGKSSSYPSVKLRMDFRDPNIVGTFVYHCHLLEHEDGGMMGTIQVVSSDAKK